MAHPISRMFHTEIETIVDLFLAHYYETFERRGFGVCLVVILRGMPGSGKSTFASLMKIYAESKGFETMICSADDYFCTPRGGFAFDKDRLGEAHEWCRARFISSLRRRVPVVIVDNTNVKEIEWRAYGDLAGAERAELACVVFRCPDIATADDLRQRAPPGKVFPSFKLDNRFDDFQKFTPAFDTRFENVAAVFATVEPIRDVSYPTFDPVPETPIERLFFDEIRQMIDSFVAHRAKYANQQKAAYAAHDHSHATYAGFRRRDCLVVILRGISGCGKSTFAAFVKLYASARGLISQVCSNDEFFRKDRGEFEFRPDRLSDAERECSGYFTNAFTRPCNVIVVDNGNLRAREWQQYSQHVSRTSHWLFHVNFSCGARHERVASDDEPNSWVLYDRERATMDFEPSLFRDAQDLGRRSFKRLHEEDVAVAVVRHRYGTAEFMEAPSHIPRPPWAADAARVSITVSPIENPSDVWPSAAEIRDTQRDA